MSSLRAPFPYFGGKSRCAHLIWEALGDVPNYCEPFFGSGAVLLSRPTRPRTETVNDLSSFLACFWRAISADPDSVAMHSDWPVNEADLHARHRWLVNQSEFRERMRRDPEFYDARVAGWWVWGISMWIGGGWCATAEDGMGENPSEQSKRPRLDAGAGVHSRKPHLGAPGSEKGGLRGVHRGALRGEDRQDVLEQMPKIGVAAPGNGSSMGGVHRDSERVAVEPGERIPQVANPGRGVDAPARFSEHGDEKTVHDKIPQIGTRGRGVVASAAWSEPCEKKPYTDAGGRGGERRGLSEQVPLLTGGGMDPHAAARSGDAPETHEKRPFLTGRGMDPHSSARSGDESDPVGGAKRPNLGSSSSLGVLGPVARTRLYEEFRKLAARLRDVRVCCGDWSRVLTPAVTTGHGLTGVFLDPPYEVGERATGLYAHDGDADLCASVRKWCVENGNNPLFRIVYAGYSGGPDEELTRAGWRTKEWKAQGGFGCQRRDGTNENAHRETLWLSPHCLHGQRGLFA